MNHPLRLKLTDEQRKDLKANFDLLKSVEQKFKFWEEKFHYNYSLWIFFDENDVNDFLIFPQESDEIEILNKLNYSVCKGSPFFQNHPKLWKWKKKFIENFENSQAKDIVREYELKRVDDYIFVLKSNASFIRGYENYLLRGEELNWRNNVYFPDILVDILAGIEFAKYRGFVKNYNLRDKNDSEIKLNGEQKFLVFHYLGFGDEINTNIKKALLYDVFITDLKLNSIRPMFSDFTKYETEDNLNKIIDFFRLLKLDSKAREIQDKIDKLRKKR